MIVLLYILFLFYILISIYNLDNFKIFISNEKNVIKYLLVITILINIIEYLELTNFNISYILDIIISIILYFYLKNLFKFIEFNRTEIIGKKSISQRELDNIVYQLNIIYYIIIINIISILINYFYN